MAILIFSDVANKGVGRIKEPAARLPVLIKVLLLMFQIDSGFEPIKINHILLINKEDFVLIKCQVQFDTQMKLPRSPGVVITGVISCE